MKIRCFDRRTLMEQEAEALLGRHLGLACPAPHAVMLTGGTTPLKMYRRIERSPPPINDRLHLIISDERHVPVSSSQSNFGRMQAMVAALGVDVSQVFRVHTELPLYDAASRYHQALAAYIDGGGRITLGILGLGIDGHVASLFDADDIRRGAGQYAIAVPRTPGPDRVSVTRDFLLEVEKLVLMVAGKDKANIVENLTSGAADCPASEVLREMSGVELWFSESATPTDPPECIDMSNLEESS